MTTFTLNGEVGRGARRPGPPAGGAAGGPRRSSRPRTAAPRRASAAAARCCSTARPWSPARCRWRRWPAGRSSPSRASRSAERYADAFAAAGALQCGFCTPGILVRTKALLEKDGPDPGEGGPPPRRPPLPLHRLHQDPRRHRGPGPGRVPDAGPRPAASAPGPSSTRAPSCRPATARSSTTSFPEGLLHAVLRLADHARADVVRIDTDGAPPPSPASRRSSPRPTSRASCGWA